MKTKEFLKELKELDERLDIVPNRNRPADKQKCGNGISNVTLNGRDIDCPVPSEEIKDDFDPHYYYMFPNGMMSPFKTRTEALDRVKKALDPESMKEMEELYSDDEAKK